MGVGETVLMLMSDTGRWMPVPSEKVEGELGYTMLCLS